MVKKKQTEEIVVHDGRKLKVVEGIEEGKTQEEIEFERWSDKKYCLKAVKRDGDALRYVKEQTADICMEAVKQNGDALRYVKEQTIFYKIIGKEVTPLKSDTHMSC